MFLQIISLKNSNLFINLYDFFSDVKKDYDKFHPHDLGYKEALHICNYNGKDLYYAVTSSNSKENPTGINNFEVSILAYGLLRGWDDGYDVPSLGICLSPKARGKGISKMFMHFLHSAAKYNGAKQVRLKVYKNNIPAVNLYKSLGYELTDFDVEQYLGLINI